MRLSLVAAVWGAVVSASNVTFFGAPRFSLGDTLPNRDAHGNVFIAQDLSTTVKMPSCKGGSSANARSIAYYQEWNTRTRPCDKVRPSQIKLDGLTQLNLAFAYIDPVSFKIRLQNPQDDESYREFVGLKDRGLKVWLGVGGWEFSDEGPTRSTWSDMAGSPASRKAFITSTIQFLKEYGFQGLDVDWEWPAAASRGGRPEDTQNQAALMKELREAFGQDYGLTCVIPHDNSFLEGIDVKALAEHVDWFNVLTYDLHGLWDQSNPAIGAKIRPHTDLKEIDTHLEALWATGVDPGKFALGLAYYGRGYTAADPGCLHYDCAFSGPSTAGECSNQAGVLSGCEIKRVIRNRNLTPSFIEGGAGAMQITWDNQWISYDNDRTFSLKKDFANERCMGGTAVWAIDYDSCNDSGELPPVSSTHSSVSLGLPSGSSIVSSIGVPTGVPSPSGASSTITSPAGTSGVTSSVARTSLALPSTSFQSKPPTGSAASTAPAGSSRVTSSVATTSTWIGSEPSTKSAASSATASPSSVTSSVAPVSSVSKGTPIGSETSTNSAASPTLAGTSDVVSSAAHTSSTGTTTLIGSKASTDVMSMPPTGSRSLSTGSSQVASSSLQGFSSSRSAPTASGTINTSSALSQLPSTSEMLTSSVPSSSTNTRSSPISLPSASEIWTSSTFSSSVNTASLSSGVSASTKSEPTAPASSSSSSLSITMTTSNSLRTESKSRLSSAASSLSSIAFTTATTVFSMSFTTSSASSSISSMPSPISVVTNSETSTSNGKSGLSSTSVRTSSSSTSLDSSTMPTSTSSATIGKTSAWSKENSSFSTVVSASLLSTSNSATDFVTRSPTIVTQGSSLTVRTSSKTSVTSISSVISTSLVIISSSTTNSMSSIPTIETSSSPKTLESSLEISARPSTTGVITSAPIPLESVIVIPTLSTKGSIIWSESSSGGMVPLIPVCTGDCDSKTSNTPKPTHTGSPDDSDSDDEVPIVPWLMFPDSNCPPDSARAKAGKNRGFFGCGCGWSGLDHGPGCPKPKCGLFDIDCWVKFFIELLWFKITPCGHLFECNPCKWVGCPGKGPECGIFGCDGYCFSPSGCDPDCPEEVCGSCITKGDCPGIKPGPPPGLKNHPTPTKPNPSETPEKTRKPTCGKKDYVTATEVVSLCVKKVLPVSVAVNSTTSTTISTCSGQTWKITNCPPMPGFTTTEWETETEIETASCTQSSTVYSTFSSCLVGTDSIGGTRTSSCMSTVSPIVGCDVTGGATKTVSTTSKPGDCTLAPLIWGEWDGDNTGLPRNVSAMTTAISISFIEMKPNATGGSCSWSPLVIEDDEGDNVNDALIEIPILEMKDSTSGGSCPWIAVDIDDAEGDNFSNYTIIIPTLEMKNDTVNGSCPYSPLLLDDDEGDNYMDSSIAIPSLSMKSSTISIPELSMKPSMISIPELTMKPSTTERKVAPTLSHQPITKPPKAPTLSQTSHPTPPPSTADSPSPTAAVGPKPIAAGGKWEIEIEHSPSKFHWTLYDAGGNEAGGGDYSNPIQCYGRDLKDCFPFEIQYHLDPKKVETSYDFEVMLDLPSGRRLKFDGNGKKNDLPEDGYPGGNYGCGNDDRNQYTKGKSRRFWCYFQWLGQGGWDGHTDKVGV